MPQANQTSAAQNYFPEIPTQGEVTLENGIQLDSVMSELNRLSKSFVNSYQTLESQVKKLNGQLKNEAEEKQSAMQENQQLLVEKAALSDRLQNLLSIMPAGVVVIDSQGKVKDCNAVATEILGRPLLGQLWVDIIRRAFDPQDDDGHQISLKDGRKIHIETKALDAEPGQIVVLTDLTKTRQLQAELSQQQKLSSMGKMIASLAHQIRTPLSAAILYGSHLTDEKLAAQLKHEFSQSLMERLHYMERQITDMLNFVKGERKTKSIISVKSFYQKLMAHQAEFLLPVTFVSHIPQNSAAVIHGDQDALLGAVMNLIENAVDACKNIKHPQIKVKIQVAKTLLIEVSDNGCGIEKSVQQKIFEPFYTSKNNGNGLGLAIVHGVVIEHQGNIQVNSSSAQGTCFRVNIPLSVTAENLTSLNSINPSPNNQATSKQEKIYEF
ncbi:sensor histidine kinase [Aliikangiella maris]|uniref:histidine kinase n=2 Tax=Aliikangiella maris TaxID=3162458 RepID=A0ABV2BSY6_9GAMM